MSQTPPRLAPLSDAELNDEQRELLAPAISQGMDYNIFRTLIRHPKLYKRWQVFGTHVLRKSSLSVRDREIVILRVAVLWDAEYEWAQHVRIGKNEAGFDEALLAAIVEGSSAALWKPHESALIRAVEELKSVSRVSDATWRELSEHYNERQLLDTLFTVGQYSGLAMVLNSVGVNVDSFLDGYPPLP